MMIVLKVMLYSTQKKKTIAKCVCVCEFVFRYKRYF